MKKILSFILGFVVTLSIVWIADALSISDVARGAVILFLMLVYIALAVWVHGGKHD